MPALPRFLEWFAQVGNLAPSLSSKDALELTLSRFLDSYVAPAKTNMKTTLSHGLHSLDFVNTQRTVLTVREPPKDRDESTDLFGSPIVNQQHGRLGVLEELQFHRIAFIRRRLSMAKMSALGR